MPFRHSHSEQRRPARAHAVGPVLGPHARTDRTLGTQHLPHSVPPCGPALLAVGVAEGRPRGGCLPPL